MEKQAVQVSIFNRTYSLVSDKSEQHLQQAANLVDQQMKEIAQAGIRDEAKVAILAALQLSSLLLQEKSGAQECKEQYEEVLDWVKKKNQALSHVV